MGYRGLLHALHDLLMPRRNALQLAGLGNFKNFHCPPSYYIYNGLASLFFNTNDDAIQGWAFGLPKNFESGVGHQMCLADGPALRPDGPRSGLSAVVARTVRACAESVRVPSFSRDWLPKTTGLTRKSLGSGSRPPPLYR
jgi:hypothetical protein